MSGKTRGPNGSTGPRTPGGKARSARNAVRHGLAAASGLLASDPMVAEMLARLGGRANPLGREAAADIAAAHAAACRARAAIEWELGRLRRHLENDEGEVADLAAAAVTLRRLQRYHDRAVARRRKAIRRFDRHP